MKHIDEYRDRELVEKLVQKIKKEVSGQWNIMEVCGGQTHSIMKYNLLQLLPSEISLIHGPGCPVCVTPVEMIDHAITLARMDQVILTSFGDMLRVPGSQSDLLSEKAAGADIRMVYSPLDALDLAKSNPGKEVVFFAVGFETTAPAVAMTIQQARIRKLKNFSVLVSHVLVPPAIEALLSSEDHQIDAFLAAGHVCAIMGTEEYEPIAEKHAIPIVITGFEPVDILLGISYAVEMLEQGRYGVYNAYSRIVKLQGNRKARGLLKEVFDPGERVWRGIGPIPSSGFRLSARYRSLDAAKRFRLGKVTRADSGSCIAGLILTGKKRPSECVNFGSTCTPERPMGAPMVSTEGACAAYYRYDKHERKIRK
ncbi:MAG: hydrogenase formation protein HypD [Bacteroidota bacterium]